MWHLFYTLRGIIRGGSRTTSSTITLRKSLDMDKYTKLGFVLRYIYMLIPIEQLTNVGISDMLKIQKDIYTRYYSEYPDNNRD